MKKSHIISISWIPIIFSVCSYAKAVDQINLPSNIVNDISCSGDFKSLESLMPAYTDTNLSKIRTMILETQVSTLIRDSKKQSSSTSVILSSLDQQANQHDRAATQAASMANNTDGRGSKISIAELVNQTLPLDINCNPQSTIHLGAICTALINRWGSLSARYSAEVVKKCW
jgi:hypothetical protein